MGRILCLIGFVLLSAQAWGQGKEIETVRTILERTAEELAGEENEMALEEIAAHFEKLLQNPMEINRAKREELQQLGILTDFQIESLLEYRQRSGDILSATELQLVNGFHKGIVEVLEPFITFGQGTRKGTASSNRSSSSVILLKWWLEKGKEEYIGPPFYSQIKYTGTLAGKFTGGFTLEKDPGERITGKGIFPTGDFLSFHIGAQNLPLGRHTSIRNLILGDYTVKLGQGLSVWNSFALNGDISTQSAFRRGNPTAPYTSSDENRFFRGGTVTINRNLGRFTDLETTLFFSLKNVDARIKGDTYTSLPSDGLHNTVTLLPTRKTLGEIVYGASTSLKMEKTKIGINYIGYGYNAHNGRKVQEYNRYQMYDGQHGNFSLDISSVIGKVRIFAETALDYGGNFAIVCGVISRIAGWESAATYRSYSKSYIAPYAGAISTGTSCSNQEGFTLSFQKPAGNARITGGGTYTFYPHTRYGMEGPSSSYKLWWKGESATGFGNWDLKLYCKGETVKGADKSASPLKLGLRGSFKAILFHWLWMRLKGETSTLGFAESGTALAIDTEMKIWKENIKLLLRGAYFNCPNWDNRLYIYEYDLPSSYVSRLMYGKGFRWYALLQCRIWKNTLLHLKADSDPKVKLGLKMRFF